MKCSYGCGQEGIYYSKRKRTWRCCMFPPQCPAIRKKLKENHADVRGKKNPMFGKKRPDSYKYFEGISFWDSATLGEIEERNRKISVALTGKLKSEIHRKNLQGKKTKEHIENNRDSQRRFWNNLSEEERIERLKKTLFLSPNKWEMDFDGVTPGCIKFVGDGSFWVSWKNGKHKNPDFLVEGQRKIIELFGEQWHSPEEESVYLSEYKKIGFDCLVIWYKDWIENRGQALKTVENFMECK